MPIVTGSEFEICFPLSALFSLSRLRGRIREGAKERREESSS